MIISKFTTSAKAIAGKEFKQPADVANETGLPAALETSAEDEGAPAAEKSTVVNYVNNNMWVWWLGIAAVVYWAYKKGYISL